MKPQNNYSYSKQTRTEVKISIHTIKKIHQVNEFRCHTPSSEDDAWHRFGKLFMVFQKVFHSNIHCCRQILSYNRDVMTLRAENFEELLNNVNKYSRPLLVLKWETENSAVFNKRGGSIHRIPKWLRVQKLQAPPLDTCNNAGRKDMVTIHFHAVHILSCLISVFFGSTTICKVSVELD